MQEIRTKSLILAAILAGGVAMLALTAPAGASSAVDQYKEFVPEADGDRSPRDGDRPGGDPAEPAGSSTDATGSTSGPGPAGPAAGTGGAGSDASGRGSNGKGADSGSAGDDRATARNRQPALAAIAREDSVSAGDLGITWIAIVAAVSLAGTAAALTISRRRRRAQ